jgi:hypothetical protein
MYSTVSLKVRVPTETLLSTLKENRHKHADDYDKAKIGFRKLLVKELENKLIAAKDGKKISLNFKNQKPTNHLSDYDDIIGMLEMAADKEIELDHIQYKQYVQNQWEWTHHWSTSNMAYLSAAL